GYIIQEHLPKELKGKKYYFPTDRGFEKEIRQRLEKLKAKYKNSR
ncbi:unnamed protein product, partial [marine sediment metagenome]